MSAEKEINNNKINFLKINTPLYFSPYSNKKHNIGNLYTEPRNIHKEAESNLSKNQIKQKINNGNINKNLINIQQPDTFKKNAKLLVEVNDKFLQNKQNSQSYKKFNSKLCLKKNKIQNISFLNDMNNDNNLSTQQNANLFSNKNNDSNLENNQNIKNKIANIKFNIGKSSQKILNSKNSTNNLKKNTGSAIELLNNNISYLRKSKTKEKSLIEATNINPIGDIYNSGNIQNQNNNLSNPKIIFLKDEYKNKDSKINQNKGKEKSDSENDNKKDQINCLLRNTFTNVKIYPTTILNNKIIYNQIDKNNNQNKNNFSIKNNKTETNNNDNNSIHLNNSKIKKEKIVIETVDKKPIKNKVENFQSIEELHYFYVDIFQKGKIYAKILDKCNN